MIITFTNVIGAIRSLGEAAQVITTNLKMWLGFETSETLGREEVFNGDFSDGTNDWSEEGNSTISVGTYEGKTDVANINITDALSNSRIDQAFNYVNGKTYQVSVEVYLEVVVLEQIQEMVLYLLTLFLQQQQVLGRH